MGFNLDLYKTQTDIEVLNNTILNIVNVLQKNSDIYSDTFPINVEPFSYNLGSEEKEENWKRINNIDENATPEESFEIFRKKYKIESDNIIDIRKIIGIRYEISQNGYSWSKPVTIAKNISSASVMEFSEKSEEFKGINIVVQPTRAYISENLASHIIGYIGKIDSKELEINKDNGYENNDYIGKSGIEYVYEKYLKGEDGIKQTDMAVDGSITDEYVVKEATAGSDVILTIDANLQKITESALASNIEKIKAGGFGKVYNAKGGAAVVMNVKTGEILSLASCPDYLPEKLINGISNEEWQELNDAEIKPLFNRAVQGKYAPGSIFKMVTAIAGLESGAIKLKERINDTGTYPYYHKPHCWYWNDYKKGHGLLDVSGAIKHSCNYFFYEVGRRMGVDTLEQYSRYFGLGGKTGVELPNETSGVLATRETAKKMGTTWQPGDILSAVIGQSYNTFSPLQIAKYISILTNGGKQVNPTLIKSIITANGEEISREEIEKTKNEKLELEEQKTENLDINQENIKAVLEGMKSVTSETGGTAYARFKDFNIEVGGKTGSAEAGENVNAWFVGFAPYDEPEIAVVVMVENGGHGNYTAEVVREIIAEYFGMNTNQVEENITAIPYTEIIR